MFDFSIRTKKMNFYYVLNKKKTLSKKVFCNILSKHTAIYIDNLPCNIRRQVTCQE